MKLVLRCILILLLVLNISIGYCDDAQNKLDNVQIDIRDADSIDLPSGIVISVINMQEISTENCPIGYKVKFVSTNDLYVGDVNLVPSNTEFYGYIEKINEPIVGTNASMKVKITKLVLPDGYEMPIKGYLYTPNNNLIGGELSAPAQWVKVPHYQSKYQGISWIHRGATLQVVAGGSRTMGSHVKVPSGEQRLIILTAPANFTHTYSIN